MSGRDFYGDAEPVAPPPRFTAHPYVWRDPSTFPRREWLYGRHLIRKFTSCTVAPGGVGKTSLLLVEAVAMATGRNLLGSAIHGGPHRVWVFNLEDPQEELERRVAAILLHYGIAPEEIEGRLFLDNGRDQPLTVAQQTKAGTVIVEPVVDALTAEIDARGIDVFILDPFVSCHRVPENDNGAIDDVAKTFGRIADRMGCAIELVHHVRKTGGQEITVEDGRGAVALLSAVRSARVLNPMSAEEAEQAGITERREFFRTGIGKANLAPPTDKASWYRMRSVSLGNGTGGSHDDADYVGVVDGWTWPDMLATVTVDHLRQVQKLVAASRWRANCQARDWVGNAVATVLGLDLDKKADKAKALRILKTWLATGALVVVEGEDDKRNKRSFVEVGEWASD